MSGPIKRFPTCHMPIPIHSDEPPEVLTPAQVEEGALGALAPKKIQYFDNDLSKVLEDYHFGEYSYGRSYPSKGMFSVSIPDPVDPSAEFFYNYFTPNERQFIEKDPENLLYDSKTFDEKDIQFLATVEQVPRYVKISFKPPKTDAIAIKWDKITGVGYTQTEDLDDFFMGSFLDLEGNLTLDEIVSKITIEGASSNFNYTGVEIVDTLLDKKIYNMLKASLAFQNIDSPVDSPRERAVAFKNKITNSEGIANPTHMDKSILVDILSETQPAGIALAPHDVEEEVALSATDPITKQSFSTKFNNMFIHDLIEYNTITMNTVFEDELRALQEITGEMQAKALDLYDANNTYSHDHHLNIEPINIRSLAVSGQEVQDLISELQTFAEDFVTKWDDMSAAERADFYNSVVGVSPGSAEKIEVKFK